MIMIMCKNPQKNASLMDLVPILLVILCVHRTNQARNLRMIRLSARDPRQIRGSMQPRPTRDPVQIRPWRSTATAAQTRVQTRARARHAKPTRWATRVLAQAQARHAKPTGRVTTDHVRARALARIPARHAHPRLRDPTRLSSAARGEATPRLPRRLGTR